MITLRNARPEDAPFIAQCIVWAVGEEIAGSLASVAPGHTLDDVKAMFASLAQGREAQYSYLNTIVAADEADRPVGAVIVYDGALLRKLQKAFPPAAERFLGFSPTSLPEECLPDEVYIDTLAVSPGQRGQGIARRLLEGAIERAREMGKPAALLVDKDNHRARKLYDSMGFTPAGERPFGGVMMDHLLLTEVNRTANSAKNS